MHLKHTTICVCLLIPLLHIGIYAAGQQRFVKRGYIVTNAGDTIRGKVIYENWEDVSPYYMFFAADSATEWSYRDVRDTKYWEITNTVAYERHLVPSPHRDPADPRKRMTLAFLKVVLKGKYFDLYKVVFPDIIHDYYYIAEKGKSPVELVYESTGYGFTKYSERANPFRQLLRKMARAYHIPETTIRIIDSANMVHIEDVIVKLNQGQVYYQLIPTLSKYWSLFGTVKWGLTKLKIPGGIDRGTTTAFGIGIESPKDKDFNGFLMRLQVEGEFFTSHKFRFFSVYPSITPGHSWIVNPNLRINGGLNVGYYYSNISVNQEKKMEYLFARSFDRWMAIRLDCRLLYKDKWEIGSQLGAFNTMTGEGESLNNPRNINFYLAYHFGKL